ncbi:hypothetical protein ABK040_003149 [Willaertia magna]
MKRSTAFFLTEILLLLTVFISVQYCSLLIGFRYNYKPTNNRKSTKYFELITLNPKTLEIQPIHSTFQFFGDASFSNNIGGFDSKNLIYYSVRDGSDGEERNGQILYILELREFQVSKVNVPTNNVILAGAIDSISGNLMVVMSDKVNPYFNYIYYFNATNKTFIFLNKCDKFVDEETIATFDSKNQILWVKTTFTVDKKVVGFYSLNGKEVQNYLLSTYPYNSLQFFEFDKATNEFIGIVNKVNEDQANFPALIKINNLLGNTDFKEINNYKNYRYNLMKRPPVDFRKREMYIILENNGLQFELVTINVDDGSILNNIAIPKEWTEFGEIPFINLRTTA